MPTLTIQQRLDALLPTLQDSRFLSNRGIGNEIGFYIFDYDPEHEPLVQQHIERLQVQLAHSTNPVKVVEINLYQTILEILEGRQVLQKAFDLEAMKGSATLSKMLSPLVRPAQVVDYIQKKLSLDEQLVLLTGIGASWPLLRSHTILNNLHPVLDRIPLVMFFPGLYDGQELRLFNIFKDDNYYRAFPLIPRQEHPS
jgi:hypothetical protein